METPCSMVFMSISMKQATSCFPLMESFLSRMGTAITTCLSRDFSFLMEISGLAMVTGSKEYSLMSF